MGSERFEVQLRDVRNGSIFLGKLQEEHVKIIGLHVAGHTIFFETDRKGIQAIRRFRRIYRVRVTIKRKGAETVHHRLFASLLFLIVCLIPLIASLFLWNITIDSDVPEIAQRMETKLDRAGISVPTVLSKLPEEDEVRRLLMQNEPSLSWIRFSKMGTTLTISPMLAPVSTEIKEEVQEKPSHLVAKTGGIITRFALTRGERASVIHQTVKKGDMLATGILEQGDKTTVVGADGEVFADYWLECHFELPRTIGYYEQGQENIEFGWQKPWKGQFAGIDGLRSPLIIDKSKKHRIREVYLKEGMEETIILPLIKYDLLSKKTNERIIKEENILHVSFTNDKVSGTILFLLNENIAVKRPLTQGD